MIKCLGEFCGTQKLTCQRFSAPFNDPPEEQQWYTPTVEQADGVCGYKLEVV